jgi:NAD-dependent SIR2 family protein deacetylase
MSNWSCTTSSCLLWRKTTRQVLKSSAGFQQQTNICLGRFWNNIGQDFEACDCLIVLGTSLAVAPFNGLIGRPNESAVRVYINRTKPGSAGMIGWVMGLGRNRVDFDGKNDLVLLDDCDKTVREICKEAGWEQELDDWQVKILEP